MKRTLGILAVAGLVFALGCAKLKSLTNINVDIPYTQTINLPSVYDTTIGKFPVGGVQLPTLTFPVATNAQATIAQYNTTTDKITSISMGSATLQMTNPSGAYFDYLDSVSVYLSTKTLPQILIAYKAPVPKSVNTFNLDIPADSSLKSYFLADTMYIGFNSHFNNVPPANTQIKATITMHMVANPLN